MHRVTHTHTHTHSHTVTQSHTHSHAHTHTHTHTLSPTHTFPTSIRVHKYTDDIFYYKAYREDPDASFNGTILSTKA
jgi:hypothetical protein